MVGIEGWRKSEREGRIMVDGLWNRGSMGGVNVG